MDMCFEANMTSNVLYTTSVHRDDLVFYCRL